MPTSALPHAPPAQSRDLTDMTSGREIASIVRVNTQELGPHALTWPRVEFFDWFDEKKKAAGYTYDSDVAKAAGISHTSISGWRTGRQRPNVFSLSDVAKVLKTSARLAWAKAGLLTDEDLREMMTPEELDGLDLIEASNLDRNTKDKLKALHLARVARDREDSLQQLREQIDLLDRE